MNSLAVAIAIVLLPGLVASVICDKITVHSPRWGAFKYSIYSFLFGILSYGLLQFIEYGYHYILSFLDKTHQVQSYTLGVWSIIQNDKAPIALSEVGWATLLAPIVALIAAWLVNYKILNKIAQKLNISQKYGDENLYSFFLNLNEVDWVYVRDKINGFTYFGRVVSYSECDSIQEIVLSEVGVYEYESSELLYPVSIIYLSKPLGSFVIEVPEPPAKESEDAKEED
ncbi:MAG: hypothetical protein ACYCY1_08135 [Sulfuriferula sp.]